MQGLWPGLLESQQEIEFEEWAQILRTVLGGRRTAKTIDALCRLDFF